MRNDLTSMFGWAEVAGIADANKDNEKLTESLRSVLAELSKINGRQAIALAEAMK